MRDRFPGTRWLHPELLHLTLVFMGQTPAAEVPAIEAALEEVARRHARYLMRTDGANGHIDDRPGARRGGVAWLTLSEGGRQTADLALDVDTTTGAHTYDLRRRPRPHLTVARNVDGAALAALGALAPRLALEWLTSEIVLVRSHLGSGGSRYEVIGRRALIDQR